jgi:peptide/nickel transport system substrate-binding protein
MEYHSTELDKAVDAAHYTTDPKIYDENVIKFVQQSFDDVPAIPLFQPYLNVAMRSNVTGYRYLFHRQLDYRHFAKT